MQYQHNGAVHSVSRITGPHHNYLAVTFSAGDRVSEVRVTELPPRGECDHPPLDPGKVLAAVLAGVGEGNLEHGGELVVASVRYVSNDTGSEDVYRFMARSLAAEVLRHQDEERADSGTGGV
jgi:hypothetical protein